jgi:tetrahydromethanopterin S-methyltransferase subunit A
MICMRGDICRFQRAIIKWIEIIDTNDLMAILKEAIKGVRADESGATC